MNWALSNISTGPVFGSNGQASCSQDPHLNAVWATGLPVALRMFQDINGSRMILLMAASMLVLLPVLLLFFAAQRFLVRGIVLSGIKGKVRGRGSVGVGGCLMVVLLAETAERAR